MNRSHALLITCLQFGAIASGTALAVSPAVAVAQVDVSALAKAVADSINGIVHANPTAPPENLAALIVTAVRPQIAAVPDDQKCQVLYQARALVDQPRPPAVDAALRSLEPADGCASPTAAGPRGPGSWPGSNNPGLGGGGGGGGSHGSSS